MKEGAVVLFTSLAAVAQQEWTVACKNCKHEFPVHLMSMSFFSSHINQLVRATNSSIDLSCVVSS